MDRTDPRWVVAQIDIGWAVCGAAGHAAPNRAVGEAVRDADDQQVPRTGSSASTSRTWSTRARRAATTTSASSAWATSTSAPMFAAAANRVKYYLAERDPVGIGGPTNFNPFINTANSAATLKSAPTACSGRPAAVHRRSPAGTAAATTQMPIVVTNDGDAPLIFTTAAADDRGRRQRRRHPTAADFAIVSQNCSSRRHDGHVRQPGGHVHRQRRLQADAHQLHVGRPPAVHLELRQRDGARAAGRHEHRDALNTSAATSRACCRSASAAAQLRHVRPGVARNYDTAMAATVTSTAGNATLSVTDPSTTAPGLWSTARSRCRRRCRSGPPTRRNPNPAYAPLRQTAGTPVHLLT